MHVVATAGHVDHGKSTLVRALTGMEPDRWEAELRRGMTIDLGFAWTALPTGQTVAFVDVPGHERFVPNMLAGIGPVPAVLFVVAADEGWMPQSREHLAALDALNVRHGLLVVTRSDLRDPQAAREQALEHLAGSSLGRVPSVCVSSTTGSGLADLRAALGSLVAGLPAPDFDADVRLWVDRAFTIHGAGTVVTGTLAGGTLRVGDELELGPGGRRVGVRGLQSLGLPAECVPAVARVAVNLRGVPREAVRRGDALLTPGAWLATRTVDVRLSTDLAARQVLLHAGTAAVAARVRPLGADTARLGLAQPLPLRIGDRALLRDPGTRGVCVGVTVLDVAPPALRRRGAAAARGTELCTMDGTPDGFAELRRRGVVRRDELIAMGAPEPIGVLPAGGWLIDPAAAVQRAAQLADAVAAHAAAHPLEPGMPLETARQVTSLPDARLVELVLVAAPPDRGLALTEGRVYLAGPASGLPNTVHDAIADVRAGLAARPFAAPEAHRLAELGLGAKQLAAAVRAGTLLKIADGIYLAPGADAAAIERLRSLPSPFTLSQARQALNTTRRVAVPLMELLARCGITRQLPDNTHELRSSRSTCGTVEQAWSPTRQAQATRAARGRVVSDSFVHLHVHTEYSMLDGAAKISALFAEAARLGMPAVAMTDHGNMYASAEFYRKAKTAGIKPIIGIEAYVAPGSRYHKKPVFWGQLHQRSTDESGMGGDVSGAGAFNHMTMLAENATGLRNLFRLSSRASFEGLYRKPRMDRDLIAEHASGIIATTGCPSGEVQTRLRLGQAEQALQAASDYRDIFGPENFFLELMDHGLPIERSIREGLLEVGRKLGLRPLATNDSHYVTQDQAPAHEALLCVQSGKTMDDPNRFKFDGEGYYLKSAEEMRGYWDTEVPGAADTTLLIAERVGSYAEVYAEVDRMPRFPLAEGETEDLLLRREVEQYAPQRFPDGMTQPYLDRVEIELGVISQMGFPGYFLVIGDLVRWAKRQKISVGPGRGSATGSLVAYILQITDLDPIEHSLIFERFLNPERVSPPDIDLDFDERRRGEVMEYTVNKWGAQNIAQVITFGTIKTKAAIKDSARVLHGQPGFSIADRITKALPPAVAAEDIPLAGIFDPTHPRYTEATEVRSLAETDPQVGKIMDTARGLEGLVRNAGVHACAVIMSSQPLLDVIPLWMRDDGSIITGWDYPSCEDIGLLKMDFLGLRTLTVISDTVEAVRANHGREIDTATLELDDEATYTLLASGHTLGVFQLDGAAMRSLLRALAPTHFGDIAAVLALYRPGPMAANAHLNYAERSNSRQAIAPIHPELRDALEPILGETYHLLVYQEQVMAIAQQLAGYSLGGADLLRRAMGKKKKEIIEKEFQRFRDGMMGKGFSGEATQTLWDVMLPFAGYAFNKSHTAGYGLVSYWTAYLKANYPTEFMAAQLTSIGDNKDKSAVYLAECRRMGIKVLPPDVNDSGLRFAAVGSDVRFGLGAVRNVGANVVDSILKTRQAKDRFTSFTDFLDKVDLVCCNKRTIESLIKAGAFDSLGHTRLSLITVHEEAVDGVIGLKREQERGQYDLFGGDGGISATPESSPLAHLKFGPQEYPRKQLLAYEREMLGLYVSAHPLDGAERILRKHAPKSIAALMDEAPAEGEIVVAGMISSVDKRVNKSGESWAIVTLEDLDASMEVLFFAKSYAVLSEDLIPDTAVAVKGRVNWRDDKMSVFGSAVIPLDISDAERNPGDAPPFVLRVEASQLDQEAAVELRSTLVANKGDTPLHILLCHGSRKTEIAVEDYPVTVSSTLLGELKSIRGITIAV